MTNLRIAMLLVLTAGATSSCSDSKTGAGAGDAGIGDAGNGDDLAANGDCTLDNSCTVDPDGGTVSCGLNSCQAQHASCGPVGDGCGHIIECGTCPTGTSCGGGGTPFQCGGQVAACMPTTCNSAGATCGPIGDGCGGLTMSCGDCASGTVCGAGGTPSVCSVPVAPPPDAGTVVGCGPFCGKFGSCSAGTTTTISGTVLAGTTMDFGSPDPIYNATVFIPTTTVQPFGATTSCDQCGADITGTPLVSQITGVNGKFKLQNVPCGMGINLPVVFQLGRWRRQITLTDVACCMDNALTPDQTHMPRTHGPKDDIPRIAISTGNVDALECVLRKMGIDDSEFSLPTGTGRVHIYKGNGADYGTGTTNEAALVSGTTTPLNNYDMVLFPCWGGQHNKALNDQKNIIKFADAGGRVFATHFSYTWLATVGTVTRPKDGVPGGTPPQPQPWVGTAMWNVNENDYGTQTMTGHIDMSPTFPKGTALAQWLQGIGASTTLGQIPIRVVRQDLDGVVAPSQRWLYTQGPMPDPTLPVVHYTFNTPVGVPDNKQCGRVVFSDFHVEDVANTGGQTFPAECGKTAMALTPQEKLLEFMLFDLSSCVAPDNPPPPGCTPRSCQDLNVNCGPQADGCGNVIQCGPCPEGKTCGGGGVKGQCGAPPCNGITCAQVGANCGLIGDGCGGTVDCGTCTSPLTCGGAGEANICGNNVIN